MRKVYLLLTIVCVSLFACTKVDNSGIKLPPGYIINGVTDVTLQTGNSAGLSLNIELTKGEQEQVTLSAQGLPAGVTVEFTPESGTPNFQAAAIFTATDNALAGTYPVKIMVTGKSGSRTYNMNLKIKAECSNRLVGNYNADDLCDNFGMPMNYSIFVSSVGTENQVFLNNISNSFGSGVSANLNCEQGTLAIPQQMFLGSGTISGTGTFSSTGMDISYSFSFGGVPTSCHVVMTKL
ncbi:MAG: hypothetical protein EOP51_04100 [Sphingobacteriales bacterium]|nr:MAG: hypothetical protein EOP51_04100 [Sphingobacteriales bacterium]